VCYCVENNCRYPWYFTERIISEPLLIGFMLFLLVLVNKKRVFLEWAVWIDCQKGSKALWALRRVETEL